MKIDETWIRAHLPEDCREDELPSFSGLYLKGLKVMSYGERGNPDQVVYLAENKEDLRRWQLDYVCHYVGKTNQSGIWRWYRHHAENGQWYYIEHRHYDYNAIQDSRLPGFERYLQNVNYAFPEAYWKQKVLEYTGLMNRWYLIPHWGYDYEHLRFIEISDSKEYHSDSDHSEEPNPGTIIQLMD